MAHYIVGDIHACLQPLQQLLAKVEFNPRYDTLWAVGDLIGRGPQAQATLEFLAELGPAFKTVLGNHDLHAIAVFSEVRPPNRKDNTSDILYSADRDYWLDWLRKQPLLLANAEQQLVVTHAGIYPRWTVDEAAQYAAEVELLLRSREFPQFLSHMYGNQPNLWQPDLAGADRWRFIVNAFTRMRYVQNDNLALELNEKRPPGQAEKALAPWFEHWPQTPWQLAFGHWASLQGNSPRADVVALDTGCVWGAELTLWDVELQQKIAVPGIPRTAE